MLEIRTVSKTFNPGTPNELHVLQAVNLTVNDGSFVVIIGTNGSGKSTLLNAVAGSFCVVSGAIFLTGADITKWPEHKRAKLIGSVFQNPFSGTAANMSIAENLALAAYRGKPRRLGWPLRKHLLSQLRDRVSHLNMGLEDRLKNPIGPTAGINSAYGNMAAPGSAASRRAHGCAGPQKRRSGDCAHRYHYQVRPADDPYGDPLYAAGRKPRRPPHHDAPRPHHSGLPRSRKEADRKSVV